MGKKKSDPIEEIIEEAREGYDMTARLMGVSRREKKVTVFTDAATGAELGGAEDILVPGTDLKSGQKRRWGVIGELDAIGERAGALAKQIEQNPDLAEAYESEITELEKRRKDLEAKAKRLLKKMRSTSLEFTIRAVPDLVLRSTRRTTRAALGIKKKGIPEGMEEDYKLEYTAQLLAASVASWTDNMDGSTHASLTVEHAGALRDMLPPGQFERLDEAMYELSMEVSIGRSVTDDVDF